MFYIRNDDEIRYLENLKQNESSQMKLNEWDKFVFLYFNITIKKIKRILEENTNKNMNKGVPFKLSLCFFFAVLCMDF